MCKIEKGFSLVELMIVIAILGVLLAIGIPPYLNYLNRSRMSEVIGLLDYFKVDLMSYYNTNGKFPSSTYVLNGMPYQVITPYTAGTNGGTGFTQNFYWSTNASRNMARIAIQASSGLGGGWINLIFITNANGSVTNACGFWDTSTAQMGTSNLYMPTSCAQSNLNTLCTGC
ncbi:MAG: hypothetical protein JWM09_166 [Francisellaceae bacterium]|nr:hypothetical protein [Francisellaceae bacterium]